MKSSFLTLMAMAVAQLLYAGGANAADARPAKADSHASVSRPAQQTTKPVSAPIKLIDINSASKAELMTLPSIGDSEASKIIAGRHYYSKGFLVSRNILPRGIYESIKKRIIAKQQPSDLSKVASGGNGEKKK